MRASFQQREVNSTFVMGYFQPRIKMMSFCSMAQRNKIYCIRLWINTQYMLIDTFSVGFGVFHDLSAEMEYNIHRYVFISV